MSKMRKSLAGLVTLVLMATPVPGLTENSEVKITTESKIENQVKNMPLEQGTDEADINMLATPTDKVLAEEEQFVNREVKQISSVEEYYERAAIAKEKLAPILKKWPPISGGLNSLFTLCGYKHCKNIEGDLQKEGVIPSRILDIENTHKCYVALSDIFNEIKLNPKLFESLRGIFLYDEDWNDFEEVITSIWNNIIAFRKNKVTTETAQESYKIIMKLSCNGDRDVIVVLDNGKEAYSLKETPGELMEDDTPTAELLGWIYSSAMEEYLRKKNKKYINEQESYYNMYVLSGEFNPESENAIEALTSQHEMLRALSWNNHTDYFVDHRIQGK